jgi:triphosphoribosyl-dephospho-CoA synthetase
MLAFTEWVLRAKRKKKKDEQRSSETHREVGNLNQQGQAARGNPQVAQQTVHVFAVPEL